MPYIPNGDLARGTFDFCDSLMHALQQSNWYNASHWLYVPTHPENHPENHRFILGEYGERPIICIGVNPSTAEPNNLDLTLKRVKGLSECKGYDGYMMLNVCAQRATYPDDINKENVKRLHEENLKAFEYVFSKYPNAEVWAAWGAVIGVRGYLTSYLRDIHRIGKAHDVKWICAGTTKEGHPRHPSRLAYETVFQSFDMDKYLDKCFERM